MLHFALVEDATGEIAAFTKLNLEGAQTEGGGSTLGPSGVDGSTGASAARDAKNSAAHSTAHSPAIPRNSLEIHRLYVTSRFKRRGLGSYLMQLAHDTAREQGCGWLWLGVWQYNFAAQQFYAGWGFERFSEHTFVVGSDPQVDFLLKKRLA
ncbi:GNAT family N-acetyltransferase [Alloscardovia macacae]|nr:GNAT family N-acetyltransferase [Alloscardovia macacae]